MGFNTFIKLFNAIVIPILEFMVDALEAQANDKDISLALDKQMESLIVQMDIHHIKRVFQNLFSNSWVEAFIFLNN